MVSACDRMTMCVCSECWNWQWIKLYGECESAYHKFGVLSLMIRTVDQTLWWVRVIVSLILSVHTQLRTVEQTPWWVQVARLYATLGHLPLFQRRVEHVWNFSFLVSTAMLRTVKQNLWWVRVIVSLILSVEPDDNKNTPLTLQTKSKVIRYSVWWSL